MTRKLNVDEPVCDSTAIVQHLLSLKDVQVRGYLPWRGKHIVVIARDLTGRGAYCPHCGSAGTVHGWRRVDLIDLPVVGRPLILRWDKQRLRCRNTHCARTWTVRDPRIASARCRITTRAAKWCVRQVARGRTISEIADDLGCDWHSVDRAVTLYGTALVHADKKRIRRTRAIGLDETAFLSHRGNNYHGTRYVTTICDTVNNIVIDVAPSRKKLDVARLLARQSASWRQGIRFGTLDLSTTYRAVFAIATPQAECIADPFHVVKKANEALDLVRRRVQWETRGHRGHNNDPLYSIRRRLLTGREKLSTSTLERLQAALRLGDPRGEVILAWRVKEAVRALYTMPSTTEAITHFERILAICRQASSPRELHSLARTLNQWRKEILTYLDHHYSNGPTEGLNNRIKKIKRDAYGFRNFKNYRLRILLNLGGIHLKTLQSITIP